jgi:serine/threonine-protein kinase HipA
MGESAHILKPEPLAPRLAGLVANEHFCLTLAKALGVPAAPARILRVPEPVLVVERFDRRIGREGVDRLHIIDACQALDLSVSHKYERPFGSGRDVAHIREGGSLPRLFSIAPLALAEASLRIGLLRWLIVQFLIGNSDAHGKNLSVFVEPGGLTLAPAYDLVAICIYPEVDHELAMAIGDAFDLAYVRAFDWAEFGDRCGVKRPLLAREMARLARAARKAVSELREQPGYTDAEHQVIDRIADFVLGQALRLERDAEFVPSMER